MCRDRRVHHPESPSRPFRRPGCTHPCDLRKEAEVGAFCGSWPRARRTIEVRTAGPGASLGLCTYATLLCTRWRPASWWCPPCCSARARVLTPPPGRGPGPLRTPRRPWSFSPTRWHRAPGSPSPTAAAARGTPRRPPSTARTSPRCSCPPRAARSVAPRSCRRGPRPVPTGSPSPAAAPPEPGRAPWNQAGRATRSTAGHAARRTVTTTAADAPKSTVRNPATAGRPSPAP